MISYQKKILMMILEIVSIFLKKNPALFLASLRFCVHYVLTVTLSKKNMVKLEILKSCNTMAAYSRSFLIDHDNVFSHKYAKTCPYRMTAELANQAAIIYWSCVIIKDDCKMYNKHIFILPGGLKFVGIFPYG